MVWVFTVPKTALQHPIAVVIKAALITPALRSLKSALFAPLMRTMVRFCVCAGVYLGHAWAVELRLLSCSLATADLICLPGWLVDYHGRFNEAL